MRAGFQARSRQDRADLLDQKLHDRPRNPGCNCFSSPSSFYRPHSLPYCAMRTSILVCVTSGARAGGHWRAKTVFRYNFHRRKPDVSPGSSRTRNGLRFLCDMKMPMVVSSAARHFNPRRRSLLPTSPEATGMHSLLFFLWFLSEPLHVGATFPCHIIFAGSFPARWVVR